LFLACSPDAPFLSHVSIDGLPLMNRPWRRQFLSVERQSGFTLLELLVVLVLLGIIAVLVAPGLGGSLQGAKLKTQSRELVTVFRRYRGEAVAQGEIITLDFTREESYYSVDGEQVILDEGLSLASQVSADNNAHEEFGFTGSNQMPDSRGNRLAFYPDGSSSGAVLELRSGDSLRYIRVDWLTGEVSLLDPVEHQVSLEAELP